MVPPSNIYKLPQLVDGAYVDQSVPCSIGGLLSNSGLVFQAEHLGIDRSRGLGVFWYVSEQSGGIGL